MAANNNKRSNRHAHMSRKTHSLDLKQSDLHTNIADFEQFRKSTLPELRKDIIAKMTPAELRKKYKGLLTARQIMIGLSDPDASKALAAIKDLVDRDEGRAIEKHEHKHRLEELPDKQLESLLRSEIESLDVLRKKADRVDSKGDPETLQ